MKKVFIGVIGLTILLITAVAFAHPRGMMGCNTGQINAEQQKFFDETKEMRKAMHDKRFELMEAYRTQNPDEQKIEDLEKEMAGIREKLQEKAKQSGISTGFGYCGSQRMKCQNLSMTDYPGDGQRGNCYQNRPRNCCGSMQGRMMR